MDRTIRHSKSINKNYEDDCSSCHSSYYCDLVLLANTRGCPCKKCLVKPSCMKTCDDFSECYKSKLGFYPNDIKGY